ncbi:MAG: hypothetical protein JMN27_01290 [gamma proteobacterium endosymbiont of Lamellibrachia anaximandri]|nr:hypothetical protein [gamma proteobacterium endosymbiont of Lamellibrachia anaximandri]MBL3532451.1 hypothetical protein [gamma proteobacterium endosymbiont of Lamellibrachia anaximandri]MBL3599654.1 hypothetical protein [gamma proteobacterium endosymbiont of Lamellibrachia anaximandri]
MRFPISLFLAASLLIAVTPAHSDVLLIDAINEAPLNSEEGIPRPDRGMTMKQVKTAFGEPSTEHPWVGYPPITRWDYTDFSVFFEHEYVLNSVVHRR